MEKCPTEMTQSFTWTGSCFEAKESKEKFVREFIKESFNVKDKDEFIITYTITHNQQKKTLKGVLIYDDITGDFWNGYCCCYSARGCNLL